MFKLLSKESNIFSIPVYIGFLFLMVIAFNVLEFNNLDVFSAIISFAGIALGYFCFNTIGLNQQSHIPLFLYTFFVFAFYPSHLDLGISVALLTNSFLILILTNTDEDFRRKSYVLVGAILAINYLLLPASWPMIFFAILHIIGTSERIALHIFRLIFGIIIVVLSYFSVMYFINFRNWDIAYFPFSDFKINENYHQLLYLIPIAFMMIYAVLDHFMNFNKKSPKSKFKYTFLLIFALAQFITLFLYMGDHYEFLLLIALPASIILSRLLRYTNKYWKKEVGLWVIIATLIVFKLADYF